MKTIYTFLILMLVACEENVNVIKSIPFDKNSQFIWYRDYCGSNGCDFVKLNTPSQEKEIYQYYDNSIKDITFKNNTFIIYYSENVRKEEILNYHDEDIFGYHIKYLAVPSHICNYLERKYKSRNCVIYLDSINKVVL